MKGVRGILHAHSEFSFDSTTPLAAVRELAREKGLGFVVQTEHSNELTQDAHRRFVSEAHALSDDRFLMVPGVEYATEDNKIHVLVIGVETFWDDLRLCPLDRLGELLDRVRLAGGLSVFAHPERADAIERMPRDVLDRIDAVEVWNGKTDRWGPSPRATQDVVRRRREGRPAPALVGLDLHRPGDYTPVGIEFDAMPDNAQVLVATIRARRYRAFIGPFRWDPSCAGAPALAAGRVSFELLRAARAVKHGLRRLRTAR
jgi:hypothetical protein